MGSKSSKSGKPLEWKGFGRVVAATDAAPVNTRIELGLRDDEVAEIHKIEYYIEMILAATTTGMRADVCLGMDPDLDDAPLALGTTEDLETFHSNAFIGNILQAVADLDEIYPGEKFTQLQYVPPLLVGTDVGMSSQFTWLTADGSGAIMGRLYFTRRKATVMELNQVLLKRR